MSTAVNRTSDSPTLKTPDGKVVLFLCACRTPGNAGEPKLLKLFRSYRDVKSFFSRNLFRKGIFSKYTLALISFAPPVEAFWMYSGRNPLKFSNSKLFVSIADTWYQPTVASDGTIDFIPRVSNTQTNQNESSDNDEEGEVEDDTPEDNIQTCPIARLNDDCLLQIFELLPFSERHVLSYVCRRWRNLMSLYWSKITELNSSAKPFNELELNEKYLERYLRLCPNIRSVHLVNKDSPPSSFYDYFRFQSDDYFTSQSIIKTATLCPKLEELVLYGIQLLRRPLVTVAHCCRDLKALAIKTCKSDQMDNGMNAIMKRCSQLETLEMSNCNLNPGLWLSNLRPGLKSLSLLWCQMNHTYFLRGLGKLKESLEELNLIIDISSDPLDFNKLHDFKKLEKITYVKRSIRPQRTYMDMFRNLKTLELQFNSFVSDNLLRGIVLNCPALRELNIAGCKHRRLTSEGFKVIANLNQLVKLNLSKSNVDDEVLEALADKSKNIEILSFNMCHGIADKGCEKIVQNLMNLKELHLDSCRNVTNKTVDAAVKAVAHQPDKASLIIYMAHTGITFVQEKPHPKVQLCSANQSELKWLPCESRFPRFFQDFLESVSKNDTDDECDVDYRPYNSDKYDRDQDLFECDQDLFKWDNDFFEFYPDLFEWYQGLFERDQDLIKWDQDLFNRSQDLYNRHPDMFNWGQDFDLYLNFSKY